MCDPSKVAEDWVVKGCHIKIEGVELAVRPDHHGGVCFQSVFKVTPKTQEAVARARTIAREECLRDLAMRKRWIRSLKQAMIYMLSVEGAFFDLARGRMAEVNFLIFALERYME
jgi:hypothetical protein